MAKESKNDDNRPIIVVKKVKKVAGGHHGGSWKVAYADFVTAMMAFFLLLWLLSVTTDIQKKKIADYFAPQSVSSSHSGAGGVLGGQTISSEGAMTDDTSQQVNNDEPAEDGKQKSADAELDRQDDKSFKETEENLRQAVESVPELKELAQNLIIDMTPEGLRIQIVDQDGKPMFPLGSAAPLPQTVKLLTIITGVIKDLPNKISIRGHTDTKPYGKDASYTNWELSADRSNASRRVMLEAGLPTTKVEDVQGKADREPLVQSDPDSARNRRISIILLKQSLIQDAQRNAEKLKNKKPAPEKPKTKKREEGVIYFP